MTAKYAVLGPLQITGHDGRGLRLRGDRQRSLLAMLLFHANKQVPTDRLVDALWPDVPPKSYASNLHTYVSRLRKRLGPIDNTGSGYRLRVDDDDLDLLVFRREAAKGRATRDPRAAATHLRRALAQWRDQPLADLTVPPLDAEVARLEAERFAVFEDWVEAELAAGHHADLIGELLAAVAEHPLRERLVGLLMTALWRSGRQVEALAVYRDTRATLIDETGVEPGPELREVHVAILRGEDEPPAWPIRQLPAEVLDFSGRRELVDELTATLARRRTPVVVLSGEPGVGKSMLAVRVAHRVRDAFPDGQLYAHLAGATDPREVGDVLADLLRTLGVTGPAIPDDVHARAAVLRSRLADRTVLLVLDDAASPTQIRDLLPGTSSSAVLVTSRRRLSGLAGAHRVTVPPFTDAEAAELLERVAGARVGGDPAGAGRIAAACGNLPLALRIAATRLSLRPQLRLGELADRLADERRRLDELTVSDLQVRPGLALSYEALSEPARYLFRLLGMVDVGNHPAWALAVLLDGPEGEAAVEELVESSMLQPAGVDACGEPRFVMHDIVRAYATELAHGLAGLPEREVAGTRLVHASYTLTDQLVRRLPRVTPLPEPDEDVPAPPIPGETRRRLLADPEAWFATERPALVAGIGRLCRVDEFRDGQYVLAADLFDRFAAYLWLHGYYADLRCCADALVTAARADGNELVEARAEAVLARLLHVRGRYAEAVAKYRWCADRLARLDDRRTGGWVLTNLADCLTGLGEPEEALRLADRAAVDGEDDFATLSVLRTRSAALNRLGRPKESVLIDTEALAVARRVGEPRTVALALQNLAWSLALTGELDRAAVAAGDSVSLLRGTTARSSLARSLRTLGAIHAGQCRRADAVEAFAEGRRIAEEINERPRELSCSRAIAASLVGTGRAAEAVPELRRCLAAYHEMGSQASMTVTLRLLAAAYEATGERTAATAAREEADRLTDPRDASTTTLIGLLLNLTVP
ncbi:BTAD domain-containing putative transcriptional regulator [Actinophytocola sp.]|uniref:AfsR/SARP family transcriptional regulator n=1 Tax=Actinophytocola sp. TaxID=1872138 RepID=UPI003D6B5509